jgi:hypothetical protein
MNWKRYQYTIKQDFIRGYRYLDLCGELLVRAELEGDFISGDTTPTGGKLSLPDLGIDVNIDTKMLTFSQELPDNPSGKNFIEKYKILYKIIDELFKPESIDRDIVSVHSYYSCINQDNAFEKMLKYYPDSHTEIAKQIGMTPSHKTIDLHFLSGSRKLCVNLQPFTFTSKTDRSFFPIFNATKNERKISKRQSKKTKRTPQDTTTCGIMLKITFMENEPPPGNVIDLFTEAIKYSNHFENYFGDIIR